MTGGLQLGADLAEAGAAERLPLGHDSRARRRPSSACPSALLAEVYAPHAAFACRQDPACEHTAGRHHRRRRTRNAAPRDTSSCASTCATGLRRVSSVFELEWRAPTLAKARLGEVLAKALDDLVGQVTVLLAVVDGLHRRQHAASPRHMEGGRCRGTHQRLRRVLEVTSVAVGRHRAAGSCSRCAGL